MSFCGRYSLLFIFFNIILVFGVLLYNNIFITYSNNMLPQWFGSGSSLRSLFKSLPAQCLQACQTRQKFLEFNPEEHGAKHDLKEELVCHARHMGARSSNFTTSAILSLACAPPPLHPIGLGSAGIVWVFWVLQRVHERHSHYIISFSQQLYSGCSV